MIRNVTYNDPAIKSEIDRAVGRTMGLWERVKMGGNGSRRMLVQSASADLWQWLSRQNSAKYCYLELRPFGLIVHFRSILETIAWVVPYRHLSVFRNGRQIHLHSDGQFMQLSGVNDFDADYRFVRKLLSAQQKWRESHPDISEL